MSKTSTLIPQPSYLKNHKLAAVLAIAIAARITILVAFSNVLAFERTGAIHGSAAYDTYAQNLMATGVYGMTPGVPDAMIPPLYSYPLAVVYSLFGRGYLQVGLFHILLDCFSITALYHVGKRLMPQGEIVGALAGLFYALYPYLIFQNLTLIDTPLFMALLFAFVWLMALLRERPALDRGTWALALLGGLALGLAMLVRPVVPPLAALVGVWFLFRRSLAQTLTRLVPVALVSVAVLAPWIIRNYQVFGAFVPMTTTSGANFWQGNNELTVPYFRAGYDVQWTAPELQTEDLYSRQADAERFALGFQYLREHPDRIPELLWVKFQVYWSIDIAPRFNPAAGDTPLPDYRGTVTGGLDEEGDLSLDGLPAGDPVGAYSTPLFDQIGRVVHAAYWGGLFLLGLAGVALTARYWRDVSLLWFVQISMTIVYVTFHPSTRYRVPTDPLLFLFSAYTLVWAWGRYRARRTTQQLASHTSKAPGALS